MQSTAIVLKPCKITQFEINKETANFLTIESLWQTSINSNIVLYISFQMHSSLIVAIKKVLIYKKRQLNCIFTLLIDKFNFMDTLIKCAFRVYNISLKVFG